MAPACPLKVIIMMKTQPRTTKILVGALCAWLLTAPGLPSAAQTGRHAQSVLTLDHLKNGSYLIPDLSCGFTVVQLQNGQGDSDGVKAVFGQAVFGYLGGHKQPAAAVHLAYFTQELGWLEEIVFVKPENGKLLQVAEYNLDDRQELKDMSIANGKLELETQTVKDHKRQFTRIAMAQSKQGCLLQVSQFERDQTGKLSARADLAPYLTCVEDRICRCWSPLNKDRGEHVQVAFTIKPSGEVSDIRVNTSSEVESADAAATEAILQAAPFPPLPEKSDRPLSVCLDFQAGVTIKQ